MQDSFYCIWSSIPSEQHWRLIPFRDGRPTARSILRTCAIETLDRCAGVATAYPLVRCPEMKVSQVRVVLDRIHRTDQLIDVDAVANNAHESTSFCRALCLFSVQYSASLAGISRIL